MYLLIMLNTTRQIHNEQRIIISNIHVYWSVITSALPLMTCQCCFAFDVMWLHSQLPHHVQHLLSSFCIDLVPIQYWNIEKLYNDFCYARFEWIISTLRVSHWWIKFDLILNLRDDFRCFGWEWLCEWLCVCAMASNTSWSIELMSKPKILEWIQYDNTVWGVCRMVEPMK